MTTTFPANDPKRFGQHLRDLRRRTGHSLDGVEARSGFKAVRVASWERGDRGVKVTDCAGLLAFYGWQLVAVPEGYDVPALLAERDELLAFRDQILAAAEVQGLVVRPALSAVPDELAA